MKIRKRAGIGAELRLCFGLLTRIPVSRRADPRADALPSACRWFPVVGVVVGSASAGVLVLGALAELPAMVSAFLALAVSMLLTGALHEDGLADVADGFGGGRTRAEKLEIMRDSRLGAYGALALIVGVGLRWSLTTTILWLGMEFAALALIVAATASRLVPVLLIKHLPPARPDGLGAGAGRPGWAPVMVASGLTLAILLVLRDWRLATAAAIGTLAAAVVMAWLADRQIGGQTGDVLGAAQQLAEICVLLGLVVALRWT